MIWFWLILILMIVGFLIASHRFFTFAVTRESNKKMAEMNNAHGSPWAKYETRFNADREWDKQQKMEDLWITSNDGLKLHAYWFPAEGTARRAVLCAHGYHGAPFADFSSSTRWLHRIGCDLLLIDERAHGQSEGHYITYGAKEQYDLQKWCDVIDQHTGGSLPVYLYGISMGSAAVMQTAGLSLPASVRGVIADCGFTSLNDIFTDQCRRVFHLPPYPLLWFMDLWCRGKAHFALHEANALAAMKKTALPVLFIHGTADQFVLPQNSQKDYDACHSAIKQLVWVENAQHACSYLENSPLYEKSVEDFFARCEQPAQN